ncbi:PREDICTED: neuropathy target esterase sws isoform X1 [Bactrocera latifrons]|uniref:Neuropathy target esterase sws n=2 Tax=Bactrocera latifrons TaxID=174628 RepID=A0A0K8V7Q6_BACLA|nr:PREDICTED: neuropathy target esterase sws isoform X1 [Bactrocera latifrons]
MDLVNLIRSSYDDCGVMFSESWYKVLKMEIKITVYIYICIALLTLIVIGWYIFYKRWQRNKERQLMLQAQIRGSSTGAAGDMTGLRFRKRDKMLFYGRRMLRKVKNVSGQVYGGQGRKRKAVMRFAKRILQLRRENIPTLLNTVEPPAEYLQETTEGGERVPPDALYMLQSIRIFGHFEKPIFLKLCKHTEVLTLEPGDFLFKITDSDDSVFIVQSGLVHVFISNADGSTLSLKTVKKGESVTSLLSFIDVLSGNPSFYKTVTAKAMEKSVVIRLPMQAFEEVFNENPDIMIRVIQVIMVRLQRVLFTALRTYLGLNSELVQSHMRIKKSAGASILKTSPLHRRSTHPDSVQHSLSDFMPPPDMLVDLAHDTERHMGIQAALPNSQPAGNGSASGAGATGGGGGGQHTLANSRANSIGNLVTRRYSLIHAEALANAATAELASLRGYALDSFLRELGLPEEDRAFIDSYVELSEVEPNVALISEGNVDDICIWIVLTGALNVYQSNVDVTRTVQKECADVFIYTVHPGEIVGGLAVLTGEASTYTIKAKHVTRLAFIRRPGVYAIMRERPRIVLDLGNCEVRRLSPLVRQCDYALDWVFLESGRAVYRQEENSDSTYIVLSGRMRSVITQASGKKEIIGEYGKGDLVGLVEMITETCRTTTVMAVRDSELAKLPEGLFNAIKLRYPIVVTKLISLLSHRILGTMQTRHGSTAAPLEANPVTHKYSTVALVPVSDDVPLTAFTYELYHSLCAIGPTLRLTSEVVRKQLGMHIFEPSNEYRMTSWLAQQEDRNTITLYQCDSSLSAWTQRCMRQADVVLIVGLGDHAPTVGKFEREIDRLAMRTQKELVLLYHESSSSKPKNTLQWLNVRPWVTKHHHLQCPRRMFTRKSQYRINDLYSRVLMSEPNMHSDCSRLARWLTGNSIGLVLGGGGARGAAHIGMLKAIQEAGIPIDMVGGVSIGALMGALWCSDRSVTTVTQKAREWSKKMTKWFLQLLDLTYPITSMFSGREFNKTIRDTFGDVAIEDLWIPYFTLTTDITASCHRIHTNGSLWRYIRSSMSLSGYMPPLCDPKDGHLLLDGGYVNNLPADVMHNLGAAHIIAIDVGSQDDMDLTNYGDDLSGWWLLYKKWNPFTTPVKVPDLPDIQSRLAYVSCVRQLEEVKNSEYCEYIRPPIDKYKTLAFGSFDEIRDVGYVFGKNYFDAMAKAGRLGRFNQWFNKEPLKKENPGTLSDYTFIDLAHIVCKLPETYISNEHLHQSYLFSEDEDYDGYISEPSTYKRIKIKRTGTSLSLSENEMDSDIEVDLSLAIRQHHAHRSRSTPHTPASESHTGDQVDSTGAGSLVRFGSSVIFKDNGIAAVGSQISIRNSGGSTDFITPYDALNIDAVVDELPLDPVVSVKKEELIVESSHEATKTTPVKSTETQVKEEDLRTPTPSNVNANEPAYDADAITANADYAALLQSSNDAPATPTNTLTHNSAAT